MRVVDVSGRVSSHFKFKSNIIYCITKNWSLATLKCIKMIKKNEQICEIRLCQLSKAINTSKHYFIFILQLVAYPHMSSRHLQSFDFADSTGSYRHPIYLNSILIDTINRCMLSTFSVLLLAYAHSFMLIIPLDHNRYF